MNGFVKVNSKWYVKAKDKKTLGYYVVSSV